MLVKVFVTLREWSSISCGRTRSFCCLIIISATTAGSRSNTCFQDSHLPDCLCDSTWLILEIFVKKDDCQPVPFSSSKCLMNSCLASELPVFSFFKLCSQALLMCSGAARKVYSTFEANALPPSLQHRMAWHPPASPA